MTDEDAEPASIAPSDQLIGSTLNGGWRVTERVERLADATGGNFSICYHVENTDRGTRYYGQSGFMKALDYAAAFDTQNVTKSLEAIIAAYNFEKDLVDICSRQKMRNVVQGVAAGEAAVTGFYPLRSVSYIIFEAGKHDIREAIAISAYLDIVWTFRTLHHVANGLHQLHAVGISHQDVKPSNIVEFGELRKIGDLGRAHHTEIPGPHDQLMIAGDPSYAPPELLYRYHHPDNVILRRASDLYQLGSLMHFLFQRVGLNTGMMVNLQSNSHPRVYGGTYQNILPELRESFDIVTTELESNLPLKLRDAASAVFRELADPDISLRGVPQAAPNTLARFAVQRYVSRFDALALRAKIELRGVVQ